MPGKKERRATGLGRAAARWLAWWVALAAVWLVLDDTAALPELMTGVAAAALGATAAELVHGQNLVRVRLRPAWLRRAWRPLVTLFPDTARVMVVLFRQLAHPERSRGRFLAVPFRSGHESGAHDATRRALAKAAGSFTPNGYVVGVDAERDLMLVHQLHPTRAGARDLDPLELG
jgi:multisubunit Na+/H+ antiporter MnhE subunit